MLEWLRFADRDEYSRAVRRHAGRRSADQLRRPPCGPIENGPADFFRGHQRGLAVTLRRAQTKAVTQIGADDMGLVLHLSDLHLLFNPTEQESIFDGLVHALRDVRKRWDRPIDLLAITGDVFDSSALDSRLAMTRFLELFAVIGRALG